MFQRIVLAYNGSVEGKSALFACAEIASFTRVETHLLAVASNPAKLFMVDGMASGMPPDGSIEEQNSRTRAILDEGLQQLQQRGFSVQGHLLAGEPVDEICRLAREVEADLIVVGHTRKASFASRWWGGSVGKALLDHAPCSVYYAQTAT